MTVKQAKRTLGLLNLAVVAIVLLVLAFNSVYIIQEQEQAVVITLGTPDIVSTPGPHVKIPFIQEVEIVPMVIKGFSIGYAGGNGSGDYTNNAGYNANYQNNAGYQNQFDADVGGDNIGSDGSVYSESMMITSDYNFVNVDFFLEYQVSDPERYLFASYNPEIILRNLALSYIRDTIGLHTVDEVITTGKNEIQAEIKEKLSARLAEEDIGLRLVNITIQDSEPPTTEVKDAFKNVETARQGMETAINNARKYESEQLPAARAQEDAILKEAEAQKEARINEAIGQVAVFNAMYEEYQKNPLMTRQRMFYETMEEVLPTMKIVIEGDGSTTKLLPLESFSGVGGDNGLVEDPVPAPQAPEQSGESNANSEDYAQEVE